MKSPLALLRASLLPLMLLATASAAPACAPDREDVSANDEAVNGAQRILFSRLTESLAPLRKVVQNDETDIGRNFTRALEDTDVTFSAETRLDLVGKVARNTLVALGKQTSTRRAMVRSSLQAIERRSRVLKEALLAGGNSDLFGFDEVVIGMGPQSVAYVQEAAREAIRSGKPPRRILTIDVGDKPGGTFANVGDAFFLNSTNRADTGRRAQPGQGDLNFLYDLWGVRDFDPRTWPTAGGIGDVSTVGMDLSGANALLRTELVEVGERGGSTSLLLRDLDSNRTFRVYTARAVFATGIGKPSVPIKDDLTLRLIAKEAAKRDSSLKIDPDNPYIPKVQTFTDFINYVGQADEPYRWLVGKNVVVAGGGDSANVINEFLMRIGPTGAYKADAAQVGNVGKVYWMGVSFADCRQFIDQARGRYALLEAALNSGRLVPVPARLQTIAPTGGPLKVTSGLVGANGPGAPVTGVVYQDAAGRLVTENPDIDYVLLATGFQSDAYKVFKPIIGDVTPEQYAGMLKKVELDVEGFGADGSTQRVAVATQLQKANGENREIYFIGPANEVVGGLPNESELARVNANTVSFFANVARTRALANFGPPRTGFASLESLYATDKRVAVGRPREPRPNGKPSIIEQADTVAAKLPDIARIETASELAKVFRRIDMPGDYQITILVDSAAPGEIGVRIPALDKAGEGKIVDQIVANERLSELLFGYFAPGSRVKQLEIVLASDHSGRASWEIDVLPRLNVRE